MQNILLDERDNVYIIDFSETKPRNKQNYNMMLIRFILPSFVKLTPLARFFNKR